MSNNVKRATKKYTKVHKLEARKIIKAFAKVENKKYTT